MGYFKTNMQHEEGVSISSLCSSTATSKGAPSGQGGLMVALKGWFCVPRVSTYKGRGGGPGVGGQPSARHL